MGLMQLVNGLTQNTTTPIASKLAEVYGISSTYVTAPITVSFLAYLLILLIQRGFDLVLY
jgi:hypothetical protein